MVTYSQSVKLVVLAVVLAASIYIGYNEYQQYRAEQQAKAIFEELTRMY